ncbi:LRR receptor-like serine/threonine-protein kinase [Nymphaea thermarum]|nr:LRR receptor-like serine/threonine-protein kinase [Nymphaea thermarum]
MWLRPDLRTGSLEPKLLGGGLGSAEPGGPNPGVGRGMGSRNLKVFSQEQIQGERFIATAPKRGLRPPSPLCPPPGVFTELRRALLRARSSARWDVTVAAPRTRTQSLEEQDHLATQCAATPWDLAEIGTSSAFGFTGGLDSRTHVGLASGRAGPARPSKTRPVGPEARARAQPDNFPGWVGYRAEPPQVRSSPARLAVRESRRRPNRPTLPPAAGPASPAVSPTSPISGRVAGISHLPPRERLLGYIPSEIGALPSLCHLSLPGNNLSSPIPPAIASCSLLQHLVLSSNAFVGTLPPAIDNLPDLVQLNLSNNHLNGSIPPELDNFSALSGTLNLSWLFPRSKRKQ